MHNFPTKTGGGGGKRGELYYQNYEGATKIKDFFSHDRDRGEWRYTIAGKSGL